MVSPIRKRKSRDVKTSLMVNLAGIGISLIDKTPQELCILRFNQFLCFEMNMPIEGLISSLKFRIWVANQLPLCRYNILLGRRYNSSESEDLQRLVLHISAIVLEQNKSKNVSMIDTFVLSLQALQLRLDDIWLLALLLHFQIYWHKIRIMTTQDFSHLMASIQ